MKKAGKLAVVIALGLMATGCTVVTPEATDVGVLIDRPWFSSGGGVRAETVPGGTRMYTYMSTEAVYVTVTPQQKTMGFDDFASKDNILLDYNTSIQYRITDAAILVKEFGGDWFKNNVEAQYTAIVRNAVKKFTMTESMSSPDVAQKIDDEVTDEIRKLVKSVKLPVEILNVTLGRAIPNENVLNQMNDTAAQQQRVKTLVAAVAAEEERKKEQEAKADADNAYRAKMGLTPEQYLAREIAEINAEACKSAKGGCTVVPSGSTLSLK